MVFHLRNKVAIVTGGLAGIGLEIVKLLLAGGVKGVVIADINDSISERVTEDLTDKYGADKIVFVRTDVAKKEQIEDAFKKTLESFKAIDILINNAGIMNDTIPEEVTINITGVVNGTLLAFDNYIKDHMSGSEGVIVNMSSTIGLYGFAPFPVYSTTKSGILGLGMALSDDFHFDRTKVRVLTMCPGGTLTDLHYGIKGKTLGPNYEEALALTEGTYQTQKAVYVAKAVISMIKKADTGSVWSAHGSCTYEVKTEHHFKKIRL